LFCQCMIIPLVIGILGGLFVYLTQQGNSRGSHQSAYYSPSSVSSKPFDPDDITSYPSTNELYKSGRFTPEERRQEYRRRGKSPSGVIDGEYNDTYCDEEPYNDVNRDWDADA
jgi:hypothetical protein